MSIRQTTLTKSAKGVECMLRIPGICNRDPSTSVLCHLNQLEFRIGENGKSLDCHGAIGCFACHQVLDNPTLTDLYTPTTLERFHLEGVIRTQMYWHSTGVSFG